MTQTQTPDEILKAEALQWLRGKTQDEIADKLVEAVNTTYDMAVKRHHMNLKETLFKALCEPVNTPPPNISWWRFW